MKSLELLNRRKISIERPCVRAAVYGRQIRRFIIGPRIGDRASWRRSCCNVPEGIKQVSQFIGHTVLLKVRNVIAGVVNTPLFEVSSENFPLIVFLSE